jgi:MinD superfamily P-loop ATPase
LILQGEGGVGKSFIAALLAQIFSSGHEPQNSHMELGRSDDGGYSYVFKQPTTPEEEALCKEAMEGCPVEAIGNDGEG